jgi:hypothetical protein
MELSFKFKLLCQVFISQAARSAAPKVRLKKSSGEIIHKLNDPIHIETTYGTKTKNKPE